MKYITPGKLLAYLSYLAIVFCLIVAFIGGVVGCVALVGISACMSLMFPTIFGLAVRGLGNDTKLGGAGVIAAIAGGAVITFLQGKVSDTVAGFWAEHGLSGAIDLFCNHCLLWCCGVPKRFARDDKKVNADCHKQQV